MSLLFLYAITVCYIESKNILNSLYQYINILVFLNLSPTGASSGNKKGIVGSKSPTVGVTGVKLKRYV